MGFSFTHLRRSMVGRHGQALMRLEAFKLGCRILRDPNVALQEVGLEPHGCLTPPNGWWDQWVIFTWDESFLGLEDVFFSCFFCSFFFVILRFQSLLFRAVWRDGFYFVFFADLFMNGVSMLACA